MFVTSQSPQAGQFNSYLILGFREDGELVYMSQSPQAGQFNSYDVLNLNLCYLFSSLNPLKRVNSILTHPFVVYAAGILVSLNPLKRVNSILTQNPMYSKCNRYAWSQSPQTGQFNSYPG